MTSTLLSGSVKHSPAAAGGYSFPRRYRPLSGISTCRFASKRHVAYPPLRVSCSSPSTTVARSARPLPATSPPSDFTASLVPLLLVPPTLLDDDEHQLGNDEPYIFYSLTKNQIVTVEKNQKSWRRDQIRRDAQWIGSSKGWLMYMNRNDCNIYLCNPFCPSAPIIPLPPIETLPSVSARHFRRRRSETDESDLSSIELDFEFVLDSWFDPNHPESDEYEGTLEESAAFYEEQTKRKWFEAPIPFDPPMKVPSDDLIRRGFVSKMVLSSAPPSPANNYENKDCMVAIIYDCDNKLAICKLGDKSWTPLEGSFYRDITVSRNEHSCLYAWETGIIWCHFSTCDLSNPRSPQWDLKFQIPSFKIEEGFGSHYIVESTTDPNHLLLVRCGYKSDIMEVHKLDLSSGVKKSWERVDHVDDQAFFVGDYSETMAVPARQLPAQVKPNCIYFTSIDNSTMGVFSLEDGTSDFEAFDDGLCVDHSFAKRQENESTDRPQNEFRDGAEGWAVWVAPNPW